MVVQQNGSDLHLISGNQPRIRVYGELVAVKYRELSKNETLALLHEIMSKPKRDAFANQSSLDFAYEIPGLARFRVNVLRHIGGIGAVLRVVPHEIKSVDELNLSPVLKSLTRHKRGLILMTGPTGSGKSTTLASLINEINSERKGHIITIEDPIEFVYKSKQCIISQREVGSHARTFATALHSALREDPDAILVGEMRDLETISLALTAAETGVLVLGTLHTNGAVATVDRIVNAFPPGEQARIRTMLSTSLVGVVSQQLIRCADGKGRVAATEIMLNNPGIANLIREGKTEQLPNAIQTGGLHGMQSLDAALRKLVDAKLISGKDAYHKAVVKTDFERFLGHRAA